MYSKRLRSQEVHQSTEQGVSHIVTLNVFEYSLYRAKAAPRRTLSSSSRVSGASLKLREREKPWVSEH